MLKKKLLKWAVTPLIAIAAMTAFSSFTDEDEGGGGGTNCDLCIVKDNNVVVFSCKAAPNSTCSKETEAKDKDGNMIRVKVSCTGAVAC